MKGNALSTTQGQILAEILVDLARECEAASVVVCDDGGQVVAQEPSSKTRDVQNIAALAAGSLAATRELAATVGETGFRSICHRGRKSGVFIQGLSDGYILVVIFSEASVEGLVRLYVKKVAPQLESVLSGTIGQSAGDAGASAPFEVREKP